MIVYYTVPRSTLAASPPERGDRGGGSPSENSKISILGIVNYILFYHNIYCIIPYQGRPRAVVRPSRGSEARQPPENCKSSILGVVNYVVSYYIRSLGVVRRPLELPPKREIGFVLFVRASEAVSA